jgi:hypothetical protein
MSSTHQSSKKISNNNNNNSHELISMNDNEDDNDNNEDEERKPLTSHQIDEEEEEDDNNNNTPPIQRRPRLSSKQQLNLHSNNNKWSKLQWLTLACLAIVSIVGFLLGLFAGIAQRNSYGNNSPSSSNNNQQPSSITTPTTTTTTTTTTLPNPSSPSLSSSSSQTPTTSTSTSSWTQIDQARLITIQQKASNLVQDLIKYYGNQADKVLFGTNAMSFGFNKDLSPTSPEFFKRAVEIIGRVILHDEPLKLGFIGSSVMCGHDNCYKYSFPMQLKLTLDNIFRNAQGGSGVEIRNACQGGSCGDSFANQIFCFEHMVGNDIDYLFYEWTYFENSDSVAIWHELIARWLLLLPKSPPLIIFNAINPPWAGGNVELEKKLSSAYGKTGSNAFCMDCGLKSTGLWQGFSDDAWGKLGDGMHSSPRIKGANGKVFVNWHPGPLGFQYVSDLTSFMFARAAQEAVKQILNFPSRIEAEEIFKKSSNQIIAPSSPIVITGKDTVLADDGELILKLALMKSPPACFTAQLSTFGQSKILLADDANIHNNPYEKTIKTVNDGGKNNNPLAWTLWHAGPNTGLIPPDEQQGGPCIPPDQCGLFIEPQTVSDPLVPLVFRLPPMSVGFVAVCGSENSKIEWLKEEADYRIELDGKELDRNSFKDFPTHMQKCMVLREQFIKNEDKQSKSNNEFSWLAIFSKSQHFRISQVICA